MGLTNPYGTARPCRGCEHWGGEIADGQHALCLRDGRRQVQAQPESGCVHWVRAIGSDDEPAIYTSRGKR
ncbi:hypothetical protein SAMN05445850_4486 [Paraburkholderia tuberum]|uniref:Uncharacterized protein n=1 Tax=Paraburkholderia tuberum TaxID=157910 RepID=A0A1H1JAZ5_9BURK|nr:hypothetical protein SAMN05445850_4486 [Paraburkholderia tuberum]